MKTLAQLGWSFFWISSVTLGGGMAMLPFMSREFVERRRWLTAEELLDVVGVMQSLPGLIAINMAVLVGYRVRGAWGALVASVASSLTPFAVVAAVASFVSSLADSPALAHAFLGVRAGTAALILLSLGKLARAALDGRLAWCLAVAAFFAAAVCGVDVGLVVLCGFAVGVAGVVADAWRRARR